MAELKNRKIKVLDKYSLWVYPKRMKKSKKKKINIREVPATMLGGRRRNNVSGKELIISNLKLPAFD